METETYEVLVSEIRNFAHEGPDAEIATNNFNVILEKCRFCILQQLNQINLLLEDTPKIDQLSKYIEDAVCILRILSSFVETVFKSAISCSKVKYFSTYTANIILSVFTHCKDSECIYGNGICLVEKQLKNLFKSCHDLQLTYLKAIEKQMIFNLTDKENQDILVTTLEINLKICDVIQSLDVKTMAEQWKAYTMICEKYSSFLLNENIFNKTCKLLVSTTENNMKYVLKAIEDDKVVLRSLKVGNFCLKILAKITNIFKGALNNNFDVIMKLLHKLSLCSSSYYEIIANKSSECTVLLDTYITTPADALVTILMEEESFLNLLLESDIKELIDDEILGHVLLVIMSMKSSLEMNVVPSEVKLKIVTHVFTLLPHGHKWFNIGLKFKRSVEGDLQFTGLYEHLLIHTVALASTLNDEHYNILESYLYEGLLGVEYYVATFASNLWILLCRFNDKLQIDVLSGLLAVYRKLETHALFAESPQQAHLSYTIEKLYQSLDEEKMQFYTRYTIGSRQYKGIWTAMKIRNLQNSNETVLQSADRIVLDMLCANFEDVLRDGGECDLEDLIYNLKMASTCSFVNINLKMEQFLLKAWMKACPYCSDTYCRPEGINGNTFWFFKYLDGLALLTDSCMDRLQTSVVDKILNIISKILKKSNKEIIHLLLKLFCKLFNICLVNRNEVAITNLFEETIKALLDDNNDIVQYIYYVVGSDDDLSKTIMPILENSYNNTDYTNKIDDIGEWIKELDLAADNTYLHKCMDDVVNDNNIHERKVIEGDFDLGDVDSLFDFEEEPARKKTKLEFNVDSLIGSIESDVEQISQIKADELSDYKVRIKRICDKLRNIVS